MDDRPGWITAQEAVARYGIPYTSLRKLVIAGVFTRGRFGVGPRATIYLRVEELDVYRNGGVDAVRPVKAAYEASQVRSATPAGV